MSPYLTRKRGARSRSRRKLKLKTKLRLRLEHPDPTAEAKEDLGVTEGDTEADDKSILSTDSGRPTPKLADDGVGVNESMTIEAKIMAKHRGILDNDSSSHVDDADIQSADIDSDSFREVQVFFNGRFVHEVTIPVRYSESAEAFAEIFTAAAAKMGEEEHEAMMNEIDAATNVARATLNDGDSLSLDTSANSSVSGNNITSQAARALEALKRGGGLGPNPFEEKINLFIPRGQLLEGCRLEVVVWHLDKHGKKVNMMGMRLFEGAELVNLFKRIPKPQSDMILAAGNEQNSLGKSGSSISKGGANGGNSHLNILSNIRGSKRCGP